MNLLYRKALLGFLVTVILGATGCGTGNQDAHQLSVVGTGACEAALGRLAAAYNAANPGQIVDVPPSIGSGGGIAEVGQGLAPLGRVARPIKASEEHWGLEYDVFSLDAVVFVVSANVAVEALSLDQLVAIYSGEITNWQTVGGPDQSIHLLRREDGDSSLSVIRKKLSGFSDLDISSDARTLYHDHEMVAYLAKYDNSIGLTTLSSVIHETRIVPVAIDGIVPSATNISDSTYPLVSQHAFVYKRSQLSELAKSFMAYVHSPEGKKILMAAGLQPVGMRKDAK